MELDRHFPNEEEKWPVKCMKKCSTSLTNREMQITTTLSSIPPQSEWLSSIKHIRAGSASQRLSPAPESNTQNQTFPQCEKQTANSIQIQRVEGVGRMLNLPWRKGLRQKTKLSAPNS
jgi:hypothetical protein